jgi:predicted DNA-binding protein
MLSGRTQAMPRYRDVMPKQTTVRLPDDLAEQAEAIARAQGSSVNQLIIDALHTEIDRVRKDADFLSLVQRLIERDHEILDRLAQ